MRVLVVGATGYIGSRLVPRLLDAGHAVRVLVRTPSRLDGHPWAVDRVEIRVGDATDPAAVASACRGTDAVVHLVHAMDGPGYAERDRAAAQALADGAAEAGVGRIVYLGGLQPDTPDGELSGHLSSRREVGDILLDGPVPTAVLRAGIVVGTGSASFEMIRHLTETAMNGPLVLPLPDRLWNRIQPVAVDDVLHAVAGCLRLPSDVHGAFDVGGPEVLTYHGLMSGYAEVAGLAQPWPLPVPVSAPRLTARAVAALTPVGRGLAEPLVESMRHELVCDPESLAELWHLVGEPPGGPTPYPEAVRRALAEDGDAGRGASDPPGTGPLELVSEHVQDVQAPARAVWAVIETLGGETGWYTVPGAWTVRGWLDRLAGGPGDRRTRPDHFAAGEALDWWRIEGVEPGHRLLLQAEAALPGTARLELRVEPTGRRTSRYVQRITFRPRGVAGRAYWYAVQPASRFVFAVMARTIAGVAATRHRQAVRAL